ncbi:hypothetical protein Cgig2_003281 [Carnegiea gigantea]|uniref:V-type proton ATPase subunit S1/VOA1 transmembrane domain-containing protein n=1 Tax=Carnegiea gigantea TaxID=171969 RepID=A0A9Q1GS60_9CARY|nr:hypothetical protein Cgig2_003281 [Carnegiea gigantea]
MIIVIRTSAGSEINQVSAPLLIQNPITQMLESIAYLDFTCYYQPCDKCGWLNKPPPLPLQQHVKNRSRTLLFLSVYVKSCIQYLTTISIVHATVRMKKSAHAIFTIVLIISQLCSALTLESTGPAFMWSPHIEMELEEPVNYQTLSSKDLGKSVMAKGGWSNILCDGKIPRQPVDVAIVFVGKKLHSLDISGRSVADTGLVDLLKDSFTKSNFSMAYPYVSTEGKEGTLENSLVQEFEESCENKLGVNNVIVTESCSIEGKGYSRLTDLHSVQEYVASKRDKDTTGEPDLLVFCHGSFNSLDELDQAHSEDRCVDNAGDVFHELISSLENSGAKYAVLYVSDPYNPIQYPSHQIGRFLAEAPGKNVSGNYTLCDEVCQVKRTLLEGILVVSIFFHLLNEATTAIVLLIILISGLCCMMGIDTPTRFETPQES